jgi:lipoprotein-releasing system ATP-binding protein
MIELDGVTKIYGNGVKVRALGPVDLVIEEGDLVAIMGPSGSGKSTLLYVLGALEPPTSGEVILDAQNPYALDPAALARFRNRQVGFVFQDHCLLPQCAVLDNVLVPTLVGERDPSAPDRAEALLKDVGLADRMHHRPSALSGGEKQRVAIARALIRQPQLLLCDEPTGNLDADTAARVADLLIDLQQRRNTMMIVVTHSDALASRFATRWRIERGRLRDKQ